MAAAKEVKSSLKAAREAIRNKEFKEALKSVKNVLKHDKNNYNALVFAGVATEGLEQADQALAAYKRAIDVDPVLILAWQGLCGFYEKSGKEEYRPDLIEVYKKLAELHKSDANKRCDLLTKCAELQEKMKLKDDAVGTYEDLLRDPTEKESKVGIIRKIIKLLESVDLPTSEMLLKLENAYCQLLENCEAGEKEKIHSQILHLLLKRKAPAADLKWRCLEMVNSGITSSVPLETLCQLYLDNKIQGSDEDVPIEDITSKLESVKADSAILKILSGYKHILKNEFKEANEKLKEGLASDRQLVSGWVLATEVQLKMHDYGSASKSAKKAVQLLSNKTGSFMGNVESMEMKAKLLNANAVIGAGDVNAAMSLALELKGKSDSSEAIAVLGRAYVLTGDFDKAREIIGGIKDSPSAETCHLEGWLLFKETKTEDALNSLTKATTAFPTSSFAWFWLGRCQWELKSDPSNLKSCLQSFLKAAKLDQFHGLTFLHLGHYYRDVVKDKQRACRCYKKAYELDNSTEEIGAALVDTLVDLGEDTDASDCLASITKQTNPGSGKWAWLRLGVQQLKSDDPSSAVLSLQAALRADPNDSHVWECLGDAYMCRGSYTAALKAYTKAIEIDPEVLYCYYQLAEIKKTLGLHAEAVAAYNEVLEKEEDYVPALKGLGEAHLYLAKDAVDVFFHGRCVDHCQAALLALTRAATVRPDLSCLWKLMGDSCTLIYSIPDDVARMQVPTKILKSENNTEAVELMSKKDILPIGARCYGMALKNQPDCSTLWHDLAISYFYQSQLGGPSACDLAGKAVQSLQKALSLCANHQHWTALGVIAASKEIDHPGLAQHCFIKSIQLESNNVLAWTNLGTLYLKNNEVKLAHEAFKAAQSLEPSYTACWIGQALIAESVGDDDTMDLFRHTTELGPHVEGSIGYAHWVTETLRDKARLSQELFLYSIEHMAAVPAAADAMAKYTDRNKHNAQAFNLYGLLLERLGLFKCATRALAKSLELLASGPAEEIIAVQSNYARVLCQAEHYEESVAEFQKLGETKSLEDWSWEGLAAYQNADYANSLQAYQNALALASEEADRSHLQAAIGMVAYKAGDLNTAKAAFFAGSQMSPPSVAGLAALCSLGLLNSDSTLVSAVLQELDKLEDRPQVTTDRSFLHAQMLALWGGVTEGRRHVAKVIHAYPDRPSLWQLLGTYLVKHDINGRAASKCGQSAAYLSGRQSKESGVVTSLGLLHAGLQQSRVNCLKQAQKAVHSQPDSLRHWCVVLSCIFAESIIKNLTGDAPVLRVALALSTNIMSRVEKELAECVGDKGPLHKLYLWSLQQYILLLLRMGRIDKAHKFLEQAAWVYDEDPILKALAAFLDDNYKGLKQIALSCKVTFVWQLLCGALSVQGLMNEIMRNYNIFADSASTRNDQLVALVYFANATYNRMMSGDDSLTTTCAFEETCEKVAAIQPGHPVVCLMQSLLALQNNNLKEAKQKLQRGTKGGRDTVLSEATTLCEQLLDKILKMKEKAPFAEEGEEKTDNKAQQEGDKKYSTIKNFVDDTLAGMKK